MKKLLFVAVCLGAMGLTSCIKDRTCSCSDSSGSLSYNSTTKTSKKLAKSDCDAQELSYSGYYSGVSCELK